MTLKRPRKEKGLLSYHPRDYFARQVGPTPIIRDKGRNSREMSKINLIAGIERFSSNQEDIVFKTSILIQLDK
jgi:hypothetical protein